MLDSTSQCCWNFRGDTVEQSKITWELPALDSYLQLGTGTDRQVAAPVEMSPILIRLI